MDRPQGPANKHIVFLFTGFLVLFILVFALGVIVGKGLSDSKVVVSEHNQQNSITGIQKNNEQSQSEEYQPEGDQEELQDILDDVKSKETENAQDTDSTETGIDDTVDEFSDELVQEGDQEAGKMIEHSPETKINLKVEKPQLSNKPVSKPETSVSTTLPKIDPNGQYTVQIASFKNEADARKLQNKLKSSGYPAFIKQANIDQETWFRLRVGTFTNKDQAKTYGDMLLKKESGTVQSVYVTPNL